MASLQILAGKRILVTGAARGLGRDFAQAAAEAGAAVVMADILTDLVQSEAEKLANTGFQVSAVSIDLSQKQSIQHAVQTAVEVLGGLDGLINCAALATGVGGVDMMGYDEVLWDRVMTVNVKGTWLVSQACVPHLKASGQGKIINIASD
ncbi:MAG: SDR family NAD(P)-dependent oxidoreductase, partial [Acinetobacter sp.]